MLSRVEASLRTWPASENHLSIGSGSAPSAACCDREIASDHATACPTDYQIHLHQLSDGSRNIAGLYVVEIRIPAVERKLLFSTSGQDIFIKTDAGKKKLTALEIQYEGLRRFKIDPVS
jgi:hypothetical protein